jgi:type I restriction enzyme S subunit
MRDGWLETNLGKYIHINTGKLDVNAASEFGEYPFFTCSRETYRIDEAAFEGESVLVAGNGDLNVKYFDGKFNAYQRTYVLNSVDRKILTNRFLFLYMQTYIEYLRSETRGTVIQYLKKGQFTDAKIKLPPLPEQKRIVDLISSVDSYIEALQQQLESAKRSRNAVLHELLTAGGDDWVETTLGQEFEICKNGKNYKDGISTEGIPISRIQTIASGKIDLTKVGFGNLFLEDAEGFLLEEGDILFSHINSLPHVGKVAIVQHNHLPLIHGMNLLRMRFTNSNDTNFMFYLMQNESMRDEIKSRAQIAVNQVSINISSIKTIKIVIPPLRTQIEIASMIGAWDSLIEECENNLNSSRNLRVGLLSELLSGEHEIPASYDKVMGAA